MARDLISNSNISLDSLEIECKRSMREKTSDENVDTILVPLYEKDILIKVPKRKHSRGNGKNNKKEIVEPTNYLINKNTNKTNKTSYLQMFRKQFAPNEVPTKDVTSEIRSISPEYGDTERESIGLETYDPENDFYNTEPYNEIYYDKLLNTGIEQYLEQSFDELLQFNEDGTKCQDGVKCNNLRSVSEVSQPRRRVERKTVPHIQNVRLGGLGPDVENIKPRLDRARSLQRYSEKVRMENRLKIYKKDAENDNIEREKSITRRNDKHKQFNEQTCNTRNSSYLINKNVPENPSLIKKICHIKSKSADIQKPREKDRLIKEGNIVKNNIEKSNSGKDRIANEVQSKQAKSKREVIIGYENRTSRIKSSAKSRRIESGSKEKTELPLQINFMVNVGGVRPSSALKSLEEKHRMYQEKVKTYNMSRL